MQYLYLFQFIVLIVGPIVQLVFRAIGVGFVTYVGINLIIDQAKSYIIEQTGQSSPIILEILGLMKADVAINIMLAAVTTKFVLAGFSKLTGSKRNQVWTAPGKYQGTFEA